MSNFIYDNTPLPSLKSDAFALPAGADSTKTLTAAEWNTVRNAVADVQSVFRDETVTPRNFGAVGDGVTDDTSAVAAAIATGKRVVGTPGDTYLVNGGTVSSTVGQVIDMTGCTLKLKNNATSTTILRLNGTRSRVVGGEWDMNSSNNASGDPYGHCAVLLAADYATAGEMYVHDSYGIGIKGTGDYDHREVVRCIIENCGQQGVFFDNPSTKDSIGTRVCGCRITVPNVAGIGGIYISSATPYTYQARRFFIADNHVTGPAAASTVVGITARAIEGIIDRNHVRDCFIGISADRQTLSSCIVQGNRVEDTQGGYACVEVNGGDSIINGNVCIGSEHGIACTTNTGTGVPLDGMIIANNRVRDQISSSILIDPAAGDTAYRLQISGNTITNSTPPTDGLIRLVRDCRYSLITGNSFSGASSSGYGIYLDSVPGNLAVRSNRFANMSRPMALYYATTTAIDNVSFDSNDVSEVAGVSGLAWLLLAGAASYGSGVQARGNYLGNSSVWAEVEVIDFASNVTVYRGDNNNYAETQSTGGPGSRLLRSDGQLWQKVAGSGNTGWKPLNYVPRNVVTYGPTVAIGTKGETGEFVIVPTDAAAFTVATPTIPVSGARITIRVINATGGSLGTVTWDTGYKLAAWTQPATGYSRAIDFQYDGAHWIEVSRTPTDVPN